ncbi:MAG: tetratricopeptide repeat protein [Alkalilacustris sp.]
MADAQDPTGGPGAYLAARQAMGLNDFASAGPFLDRALADWSQAPLLLENLVLARLALGDLQGAQAPAQRLIETDHDSQAARLALLTGLMVDQDHDAVLGGLQGALSLGPLFDPLLTGWTLIAQGRMSEALEQFEALGQISGMGVFGLYHTALALAHVGDMEGADAILSGEAAGPIQLTRRGLEARVQILSQIDRTDEALALIDDTLGDDPEFAALRAAVADGAALPFEVIARPRDGLAEVFFDIAGALEGETGDAFSLLLSRAAEALRPDHVPAQLMTARILTDLGQHALASAAYAAIPSDAPAFYLAEIGRAEALYRDDDADAALRVLERLAETHSDVAAVQMTLGDLLRRERAFDAASRAYDAAIALLGAPEFPHWPVYFSRAITHEREGRWDEAEADFRTALRLNPDQPHVLNYLGYSLVERRENLDEALEMIERAVAAQPDNGHIVDSLGWAFYRLGRFEEALVHMERAVELMPTDAILNDHLGDVYWALGRKREARFQWRRALSFGPADDLDMDRIRRKLEVGLDVVLIEEGAPPHHGPDTDREETGRGH